MYNKYIQTNEKETVMNDLEHGAQSYSSAALIKRFVP